MIKRLLCWFGFHTPELRPITGPFFRDGAVKIVCRDCGRTVA